MFNVWGFISIKTNTIYLLKIRTVKLKNIFLYSTSDYFEIYCDIIYNLSVVNKLHNE